MALDKSLQDRRPHFLHIASNRSRSGVKSVIIVDVKNQGRQDRQDEYSAREEHTPYSGESSQSLERGWQNRPDGYRVRDEVGGSHVPDRQLDHPGGDGYGSFRNYSQPHRGQDREHGHRPEQRQGKLLYCHQKSSQLMILIPEEADNRNAYGSSGGGRSRDGAERRGGKEHVQGGQFARGAHQGGSGSTDGWRRQESHASGIRTDERSAADSYVLLDRHRQVNRPTLPPTRDRLERHRQLQENSEPAFDDRHHDREHRDLRDDRQENDSDRDSDSGNDNNEGAQKKRKRSSGKVCTNPRQEGFYPASWKKVFARAKDLVYIYLLLQNLFPERDEFKSVQISSFLHDAMLYVVDKLGIPLEKKYKKHLTNSDDMVELIWNFVATFRNRCKELAREILKTEYRAAIFPDQAQYRGRDEWTEKVKSNVEKLLDESTYHEHGVDAQGRPNNLMHPAFERLAQSILSMGRRPLGQEFPEEFQKYRPKFIIAIMIFFRQTLEEWRTGVFVTGQLREAYYQGYYLRGLELLDKLETYPDLWDKTNDEWDCWARKAGFQGKKKTGRRAVGAKEMRLRLN
ncbi:hypothetical protein K438DRAFT_1938080 [Mycena galopus ATCC 62051]|nr:hypothetical protein K438DRAFT_1938080 [Mycena galopus ATCC 62051]